MQANNEIRPEETKMRIDSHNESDQTIIIFGQNIHEEVSLIIGLGQLLSALESRPKRNKLQRMFDKVYKKVLRWLKFSRENKK